MQHYFFIHVGGKYQKIQFSDVMYFEGKRDYVSLVTGTRIYILPNGMTQLEVILPSKFLCRIHKSYIVALDKIKSFDEERLWLCEPAKNKSDTSRVVCLSELPLGKVFVPRLRKSMLVIPARQGIKRNSLEPIIAATEFSIAG